MATDSDHLLDDPDALDGLARAAAGGDRAAFQQLVLVVHDELRLAIAWRLGQPDLVDDCLQETLLAAYRDLPRYRLDGSLRAWLKGIARHRCLAALRQRRRHFARHQGGFEVDFVDSLIEEAPEDDHRLPALRRCLERLSPTARQLVLDRYAAGESLDRLTKREGRSKGAIAGLLYRIRAQLARCIVWELAP